MNKKILIIAVAFLAMAMLATPAMAKTQKIAVTHSGADISSTTATSSRSIGGDPPKFWIGHGVTVTIGTLTLTQDANPGETLVGTGYSELMVIKNLETGVIKHFAKGVWTFPGGTFEGVYRYEVTKPGPYPTWTFKLTHCILHGTGVFQGQRLVMSYDGLFADAQWTGFLYTR